jgi:hypothetical protein
LYSNLILPVVSAVIKHVETAVPVALNAIYDAIAPLSVPHLFWQATVTTATLSNDAHIQFNCLIDNGSHLVLIHDSLAEDLSLHCHKLPEPIKTEVAMQEGENKIVLKLYKYVKLCLYDSSGEHSEKSV